MSTRAVIARVGSYEGEFKGVYSHWDGYITGLGKRLWELLHTKYNSDLPAMLRFLIDGHSAGWSVAGEECYCHPKRKRDAEPLGNWFTHENVGKDSDIEYVYAFDEENNRLFIRDCANDTDLIVELSEAEPDWEILECAEDFRRCRHMVWRHLPQLKNSNLSMQTYLGYRKLDFHDAVAFIVGGNRYQATGSGGNSSYMMRGCQKMPPNVWVATVVAANGRRLDVPVARITKDGYRPFAGVAWIYPPTKTNPQETEVRS